MGLFSTCLSASEEKIACGRISRLVPMSFLYRTENVEAILMISWKPDLTSLDRNHTFQHL